MRQTIEKTAATIEEEKLQELDRKLDQYQSVGAVSMLGKNSLKNASSSQISKKNKVGEIERNKSGDIINNSLQNVDNDFISLS